MYSLISQVTFFVSFGVIVFLFARAMPRVDKNPAELAVAQAGRVVTLLKKIPVEKIDQWLSVYMEKVLRRAKVVIMKIDHKVTHFLDHVRSTQNGRNGGSDANDLLKDFESLKDDED